MCKAFTFLTVFLLTIASFAEPTDLRVLTENWPPVSFEKQGKAQGMAVELARLIEKHIGANYDIEVLPWPRAYHLVSTQPSTLLFTMVRTPEREKLFTMVGPIATGEIALYARKDSPAVGKSMEQLKTSFSVAAHRETAFQKAVEERGFKKIIPGNSPVNNIKMLMSKRVDMICEDALVVRAMAKEAGFSEDTFVKIHSLTQSSLYFAFSKGTPASIIERWKTALENLKRNGEFKTLHQKWFGSHPVPKEVIVLYAPEAISDQIVRSTATAKQDEHN